MALFDGDLGIPDDELAVALLTLPPPLNLANPFEARATFDAAIAPHDELLKKHTSLPEEHEYEVQNRYIPVEAGEIRIKTVVPMSQTMSKPFPLLIWIHGGAFIVGSPEIDDLMLRKIAVEAKVSVVNVNHRHAPEYPYPIPLNDCYEALKWAVKHASELSASPAEGLIIGGCSSGANLAAGLALRARDDPFFNKEDGTLLTGQLLQCPALGAVPPQYETEILSPKLFKDGPLLTAANSAACLEHYHPDATSPYVSPLLASSLCDIASAYFQVCGMDLLRDSALLYERLLRENGVTTKLDTYAGYPHAAHHILIGLEITNRFQQDFVNGVRWLIDNPKQ